MDNKFILGLCIIGFGILLLFSDQEHSWIFSALAVGLGSGIILKKSEKEDWWKEFVLYLAITIPKIHFAALLGILSLKSPEKLATR